MVTTNKTKWTYASPEVELLVLDKELCSGNNGSSNSTLGAMETNAILNEDF